GELLGLTDDDQFRARAGRDYAQYELQWQQEKRKTSWNQRKLRAAFWLGATSRRTAERYKKEGRLWPKFIAAVENYLEQRQIEPQVSLEGDGQAIELALVGEESGALTAIHPYLRLRGRRGRWLNLAFLFGLVLLLAIPMLMPPLDWAFLRLLDQL